MKDISKNETGFSLAESVIVIVVLAIIGVGGYMVAKHHNAKPASKGNSSQTSSGQASTPAYEVAVNKFITAMQTGNKKVADSLQTVAFSEDINGASEAGDTSFYDLCNSEGQFCTAAFSKTYLASGKKSTKTYPGSNGAKGYEVDYTVISKDAKGSSSSTSTNVVSIDTVQVNGAWLIDSFNETGDASANFD